MKLWRSGIFWSFLVFVGGIGNFAFAAMIARRLSKPEFGYANTTLTGFVGFLNLPLSMIGMSLTHYIAHFRGQNDEARLQGLLAGCQKFLLQATVAGSVLALVLADPLGRFFHYRSTLMLVALLYILVSLWSNFAVALCQGMSWFKRLAILSLVGVCLRLAGGWVLTSYRPTAEMAVSATTFSLLANLLLLYWWKDIFRHGTLRISPWNREFFNFLTVTVAYVAGNYFFLSGDSLVTQKYFSGDALGDYQYAARWATALPGTVAPLLLVMFTSRSGSRGGQALSDQRILLTLYAAGLGCGAAGIILLRAFLIEKICGHPDPRAAAMLIPYTITMAFVGLNQAIGLWTLASRWFKVAITYGALGITYWLILLMAGHTPTALLTVMPIGAGIAFGILLVSWLVTLRYQHSRTMAA